MLETETAAAHFGSRAALAKALNVGRSAVTLWGQYVPELRARQLEQITDGQLVAGEYPARGRPGKYTPAKPRKR